MDTKCDVFISYRREGGAQYARILQLMLIQRGYSVFLDYDELTDGIFSEKIRSAIKNAPVFLLVLSKGAMTRCVNEDDWVRQELILAVEHNKHIVPVNPDNEFDGFPSGMPERLKDVISSHQHSEIGFGQLLRVSIDFLIKNRLVPTLGERSPLEHSNFSVDNKFNINEKELDTNNSTNHKRLSIIEQHETMDISVDIPFLVGTNKIDLNPITKQKIAILIQQIKSNETYLASFEVMTAFSPEGNFMLNKEVALMRANAIADVLKLHLEGITPTATYIEHSWKDVANKLKEQNYMSVADSIEYIMEKESNPQIVYAQIRRLPKYNDMIKPILSQMRYTTCRLKLVKLQVQNSVHKSN